MVRILFETLKISLKMLGNIYCEFMLKNWKCENRIHVENVKIYVGKSLKTVIIHAERTWIYVGKSLKSLDFTF